MKTEKKSFVGRAVTTAILLIAFIVFTVAVATVDVQPSGIDGADVGLAGINLPVHEYFGYNATMYKISEVLGYLALLTMAAAAATGLYQLIKGKSFAAVAPEIYLTGAYYVVVLAVYVLFEKLAVNYRPVDLGEGLEASYPSSHTVLALCVFLAASMLVRHLFNENKILSAVLCVCFAVLAAATVSTRFLSGVHWFTDILGGMILSSVLISAYAAVSAILPAGFKKQ
ncbi:MAG: phosphatase PAP2 family protein [Clostridia bacterium]|nr:phosphatase PAP2 family protein [Clostridia bacterium]